MTAYFNGCFLPQSEICISPDDRGFIFADGLYEVIRSYGGHLFELEAHIARLNYGAHAIRLPITDFAFLKGVAQELIERNDLRGDASVYLQVTRGVYPRAHPFPDAQTPLTVYALARLFTPKTQEQENGIGVILVPDIRWARCDIKAIGLLPNVMAQQRALDSGAQEALFVRDGCIMEGTHTSVFAAIKGQIITPPKTNYILGGITRQVILNLCREHSIPCAEKPIFEAELEQLEELMVVGTTTELTPVIRIQGKPIGAGVRGEMTFRLQQLFREFHR
ncbi:MAG: aminotransferase class IV [bacterium]